ncbi:GlcG/HbpS family heme-binding protein [Kaarinaea lacus]
MTTIHTIKRFIVVLPGLACLLLATSAMSEDKAYLNTRVLSAALAQQAADKAFTHCRSQGYQVAVAVVDRSGNLMAFVRDPLAGPHTIDVSQRKAYSSATYQTATSAMMNMDDLKFSPNVLLLGGGLPIRIAGHFYGAIAVSGAPARKVSGDVDEECAQAGIDTITEAIEFAD